MPPSTTEAETKTWLTGFCGGRLPASHMACRGGLTQGNGDRLLCPCPCHNDQERDAFLQMCFESTAWRTVDRETGETLFWATQDEALAYSKTKETPCDNCSGTGAIPAGGHEPADEVDNGYVQCPTCRVGDGPGLADVSDVDSPVEPARDTAGAVQRHDPTAGDGRDDRVSAVPGHPVGDRNHHLTEQGRERLVTWAEERRT